MMSGARFLYNHELTVITRAQQEKMRYVLFVFGVLAVFFGIAIYGWVFYNMFWPTKEFKDNAGTSVGQYIFPGLMIAFGVKLILGVRKPNPMDNKSLEHAVIVRFIYGKQNLSDLFNVENVLIKAINDHKVGEYDGNEVATDGSDGILYMYGPDADKLYEVIEPIIRASTVLKEPKIELRYGPPDEGVKSVFK
jgi:hypothetical protein